MNSLNIDYEKFVENLFKQFPEFNLSLIHAAVGISGEAGELLDACKKAWVYNKSLDVENVIEELGDLNFYVTAMIFLLKKHYNKNITTDYIQKCNINKLQKRYSSGSYTDKQAQERKDKDLPEQPRTELTVPQKEVLKSYSVGARPLLQEEIEQARKEAIVPEKLQELKLAKDNLPKTAEEYLRFAIKYADNGKHVDPFGLLRQLKSYFIMLDDINKIKQINDSH